MSTLNKLNKTIKEESKKRKSFDQLIEEYTDNEKLRQELKNHLAIRKRKGSLTNRALEIGLENLTVLTKNIANKEAQDAVKIQIVRKSIDGGWSEFYPIKREADLNEKVPSNLEKLPSDLENLYEN